MQWRRIEYGTKLAILGTSIIGIIGFLFGFILASFREFPLFETGIIFSLTSAFPCGLMLIILLWGRDEITGSRSKEDDIY